VEVMLRLLRKLFGLCDHDDELIDKQVLPSAVEQMPANVKSFSAEHWAFHKVAVFTFKCRKCNRIRQSKVS
jgi:pantothenate kinase type III